MRVSISLAAVAASLVLAAVSAASDDLSTGPALGVARISIVQGDVAIMRGDSGDWIAAKPNMPVVEGDSVQVNTAARAEIQLAYGNFLRLGGGTEVEFVQLGGKQFRVRLLSGVAIYSELAGSEADVDIETPLAAVRPMKAGRYIVSVQPAETHISVSKGRTEVAFQITSQILESGRTMIVREGPTGTEFEKRRGVPDSDLSQWADDRDREARQSVSHRYVSKDIYGADQLDYYGEWRYVPNVGHSWFPYVTPRWSPYRHGSWNWVDYYGWTWVGAEPWGWAPYHWGRWYRDACLRLGMVPRGSHPPACLASRPGDVLLPGFFYLARLAASRLVPSRAGRDLQPLVRPSLLQRRGAREHQCGQRRSRRQRVPECQRAVRSLIPGGKQLRSRGEPDAKGSPDRRAESAGGCSRRPADRSRTRQPGHSPAGQGIHFLHGSSDDAAPRPVFLVAAGRHRARAHSPRKGTGFRDSVDQFRQAHSAVGSIGSDSNVRASSQGAAFFALGKRCLIGRPDSSGQQHSRAKLRCLAAGRGAAAVARSGSSAGTIGTSGAIARSPGVAGAPRSAGRFQPLPACRERLRASAFIHLRPSLEVEDRGDSAVRSLNRGADRPPGGVPHRARPGPFDRPGRCAPAAPRAAAGRHSERLAPGVHQAPARRRGRPSIPRGIVRELAPPASPGASRSSSARSTASVYAPRTRSRVSVRSSSGASGPGSRGGPGYSRSGIGSPGYSGTRSSSRTYGSYGGSSRSSRSSYPSSSSRSSSSAGRATYGSGSSRSSSSSRGSYGSRSSSSSRGSYGSRSYGSRSSSGGSSVSRSSGGGSSYGGRSSSSSSGNPATR